MVRALKITGIAVAAGCFLNAPVGVAEASQGDYLSHRSELPEGIWLRSSIITFETAYVPTPGMMAPSAHDLGENDSGYFLVHTAQDAKLAKDWLLISGLQVLHYLPHNTWLVKADGRTSLGLEKRGQGVGIDLVVPYHPSLKIAPELLQSDSGEVLRVVAHMMPGASGEAVRHILKEEGLEIAGGREGKRARVAWEMPEERRVQVLQRLATLPDVFWLERRGELRLNNAEAVSLLQSGENDGTSPIHDAGLMGEGQIVGFIDTGMDHDSCFFRDESGEQVVVNSAQTLSTGVNPNHRKVHAYDFLWTNDSEANNRAYDNHGHGTHVSGNVGGASVELGSASQNGLAPEVRFVVQDGGYSGVDNCADLPGLGCPVVDLLPFFEQAYEQGARIHTNSWGDNENSSAQWTYSAGSQDVDEFAFENPDFLLIFAAGNSGPSDGSVGSPSTAKNTLSVGGSGNGASLESVVSFSSRGPTADGRLKPDVMAPAGNTSADSDGDVTTDNCGLDTGSGTSYAAPLVAGAAALVRQYFTEGYYPSGAATLADRMTPSSALMRAVLINSGRNMARTASMPSYDQGWGRVALADSLSFAADGHTLRVVDSEHSFNSSSDSAYRLVVNVTDTSVPLKVTLVWTDPASTPAAELNLVNDLDLVVSSGRKSWKGNNFRRGQSMIGGQADNLNPAEQVLLNAPSTGRYTIEVNATNVPVGPQDFALVVTGAFE